MPQGTKTKAIAVTNIHETDLLNESSEAIHYISISELWAQLNIFNFDLLKPFRTHTAVYRLDAESNEPVLDRRWSHNFSTYGIFKGLKVEPIASDWYDAMNAYVFFLPSRKISGVLSTEREGKPYTVTYRGSWHKDCKYTNMPTFAEECELFAFALKEFAKDVVFFENKICFGQKLWTLSQHCPDSAFNLFNKNRRYRGFVSAKLADAEDRSVDSFNKYLLQNAQSYAHICDSTEKAGEQDSEEYAYRLLPQESFDINEAGASEIAQTKIMRVRNSSKKTRK